MGKPCPKYTAEFKRRTVQLYNERGTTYAEVAREIGVDPSSLADWVRRASAAGPTPRRTPSRWPRTCGGSGARTSGSKGRTRYF